MPRTAHKNVALLCVTQKVSQCRKVEQRRGWGEVYGEKKRVCDTHATWYGSGGSKLRSKKDLVARGTIYERPVIHEESGDIS